MGGIRLFQVEEFDDLVDTLNRDFSHEFGCVLLLEEPLDQKRAQVVKQLPNIVCFALGKDKWSLDQWPEYIHGFISSPNNFQEITWALEQAHRIIDLKHEIEQLRFRLALEKERREEIMKSALELSEERQLPKLCKKILTKMRRLVDAEGASLFLFDPDRKELRFSQVQNEKIELEWQEIRIPLDEHSIAGACAVRKQVIHLPDVYKIPKQETFQFNKSFDKRSGYHTRNMLSIPLLKQNNDLVGIVQLINSRKCADFSEEEIDLGKTFSVHIAVAVETALLYQDIERLFEGFIRASVTAIESRDPTTSGHSERVAKLTLSLAQSVNESTQPNFRNIGFSPLQLKEIRYASLLHDFGKIGVPEKVLTKAKKLYPEDLELLEKRYELLKIAFPDRVSEFEILWKSILEANEPTVLVEELKNNLENHLDGVLKVNSKNIPLLTSEEWKHLSVKKGSLSIEERQQIESHVVHSQKFLSQIPWTRELQRVPEIAAAHHERPNGTGYPLGLKAGEIPIESQIMSVTDVFDALTAMDRPYKKAVPVKKALEILNAEAREFSLNPELVQLFKEQKIYEILGLKC